MYSVPGFVVNSAALFFIGGFIAVLVLHYRETSAWKAFVTGIGAPALISGLVHNIPQAPLSAPAASPSRRSDIEIIVRAFAQDEAPPSSAQPIPNPNRLPTAQVLCVPRQTSTDLFLSGLLGRPPILFDNLLWIVLKQRFDSLDNAQKFVAFFYKVVNVDNRYGNINPRIVKAERLETGRFWIAFGVWLTERDVKQNWSLFLEKASSLYIEVLPFSVIRSQFGYGDIQSVPSCLLASRG